MKKSPEHQGDRKKPRRLTLSRETIKILENPVLLELAKGGIPTTSIQTQATTSTTDPC